MVNLNSFCLDVFICRLILELVSLIFLAWSWVDSSPKTFENWASGEPSTTWRSTAEECVEMNLDGTWNDINCQRYERPFICSSDRGLCTTLVKL